MSKLAELEKKGFRFALDGKDIVVRYYGRTMPADASDMLAKLDRQAVINAIHDRAAGFVPVQEEQIQVSSELLPIYCAEISAALHDGRLWDASARYHRPSSTTTFFLVPPGVIEIDI